SHPAIAQLHDADTLPDGTPWFAMEYVDGEPLTDYCRAHATSLEGRLELFRSVCAAVQHAHSHAVIHRDLKPSNILVARDGAVKLLDFGIAKQLADLDSPVDQTRTGLRLMTPAYAAPEQIRGDAVGIRSDVYSLGVILYELLVGTRRSTSPESAYASCRLTLTRLDRMKKSYLIYSMLVVLITGIAATTIEQKFDLKASVARGEEVYLSYCVTCHLDQGQGIDSVYPPLAKSDYLMADKKRSIIQVLQGVTGEIKVNGKAYNNVMTGFDLSDQEVSDVLNYVRNSWGNKGEPVRPEEVAAAK
ncbi:MAG: protein kinase, partial [Bacteroidia bacterium]|nr:protein kinase [Bacteroidia bacterium]